MGILFARHGWESGLFRVWVVLSVLWLLIYPAIGIWVYQQYGMSAVWHWLSVETDWLKASLWALLPPIGGLLVLETFAWIVRGFSKSSNNAQQQVSERDRIVRELDALEKKRQGIIDDAGQRRVMISTDNVLKDVEKLRDAYISAGREDAAREVERVIRDFREAHGPEIPVTKAYALMKEIENKFGQ